MYNKLFTKILDSTVWLEDDATRLVWITFLAVMDKDGFVALSAIGNVAARARVSVDAAEASIKRLESPDPADPTQEHDGRRIERVPYGWMVLNAKKYRDIIQAETARAQTRERVAKFRAARNAHVTQGNEKVTPSVAVAVSEALKSKATSAAPSALARFPEFWTLYPRKVAKGAALKAWRKVKPDQVDAILKALEDFEFDADPKFQPHPATWLSQGRWEDQPADYGRCKYCSHPATRMTNGIPHCETPRHIDHAEGKA